MKLVNPITDPEDKICGKHKIVYDAHQEIHVRCYLSPHKHPFHWDDYVKIWWFTDDPEIQSITIHYINGEDYSSQGKW